MLQRHIEKEDEAIYLYAQNNLSQKTFKDIRKKVVDLEEKAEERGLQVKYKKIIKEIENEAQ
jgi:hemerythrin-like domain-containing protein